MTPLTVRLLRSLTTILIAFVIVGCGAAGGSTPPSTSATAIALPMTVAVAQADQMRAAGDLVLDVRELSEWATGHIAGATLIPLGSLSSRLSELSKDQTIVVVCHSGNRSAQGRDILRAAGFVSVTSMAGGMTAWLEAGLPVVTGP